MVSWKGHVLQETVHPDALAHALRRPSTPPAAVPNDPRPYALFRLLGRDIGHGGAAKLDQEGQLFELDRQIDRYQADARGNRSTAGQS